MADAVAKMASFEASVAKLSTAETDESKAAALGDVLERFRALLGNIDEAEWNNIVALFTKALEDGQLSFFEVFSLVTTIMRALRTPAV